MKTAYLQTSEGEIAGAVVGETDTHYRVIFNVPAIQGGVTGSEAEWPKDRCRVEEE